MRKGIYMDRIREQFDYRRVHALAWVGYRLRELSDRIGRKIGADFG